jgi:hypothetical protein
MRKVLYVFISLIFIFGCTQRDELKEKENQSQNEETQKIPPEKKTEKIIKEEIVVELEEKKIRHDIKRIPAPKYTKGIYLSAYTVASKRFSSILDSAEASGINTVIFDVKNMHGDIFYSTHQKGSLALGNVKSTIIINNVVETLHERNMRAVARMVMFHDEFAANADSTLQPEYSDGSAWHESEKRGPRWLDSSNVKAQKRLLRFVDEIALSNVDEIQMDYIRFPTQGKIDEAIFDFQLKDSLRVNQDSTYIMREKSDIITSFVKQVKKVCDKYEVTLTADIFAIVAWQRKADVQKTGQKISELSKYTDAIHPMIYSSHFSDDFGFRNDVTNEPYHIVFKSTKLTIDNTSKGCKVVPYIQANAWKVNYGNEYFMAQIQAVEDSGADGYLLWNAAGNYYRALRWIREY